MEGAVEGNEAAQACGFHVLQQGEYRTLPRVEISAQQAVCPVGVQQGIAAHELARAESPFGNGAQQHDLLAGFPKARAGVAQAVCNQLFQARIPVVVDQFNPAVVDEYGLYLGVFSSQSRISSILCSQWGYIRRRSVREEESPELEMPLSGHRRAR